MQVGLRAVEVAGEIDDRGQLHLDGPLPVPGPSHVRVIILIPEPEEISEAAWLRAAAANPVFDFLAAPEEDAYTLADGEPFDDPR